jgi:hypothetical protein
MSRELSRNKHSITAALGRRIRATLRHEALIAVTMMSGDDSRTMRASNRLGIE